MICASCKHTLPQRASFCPNCGATIQPQPGGISTGGGDYFAGSVRAEGDVVGGNQHIEGGYTRFTRKGLEGEDLTALATLFQGVYQQVDAHASKEPDADAALLEDTAKKVEREAAKGPQANSDNIKRWLTTLGKLAPDVLEVAVNALTNPGAAVASAVRIVARTFQSTPTGHDRSGSR